MAKKATWRDLPKTKLAAYLIAHPTIQDSSWTIRLRNKGEDRTAFIKRIVLDK